jgi:hypothetical protein
LKPAVLVKKLPFVDQEPLLHSPFGNRGQNAVKRHHHNRDILPQAMAQRQISGGQLARDRDRDAAHLVERHRLAGNQSAR